MRISTNTIYDTGISAVQKQTIESVKLQQQIASGRRILSPEDDPIASSTVLDLTQFKAITEQYRVNADNAKNSLQMEEAVLSSITDLIQHVRVLAVSSGNSTLSPANLASIAMEIDANYQQLLGFSNQKDGKGQYLFSGYKGGTQPFTQTTGPAVYVGDQGQRRVQISPTRQIETGDHGADVFKPGVTGQDLFETLSNFSTALKSGALTSTDINAALNGISTALDNILRVRASVGARLKEIDVAQSTDDELNLNYEEAISNLRDVDYAKAISNLTKQQTYLEAAQKSFLRVSGLSLFNYI